MSQSTDLFERAKKIIPGGVNSPVRAFRSVGGHPPFIASAAGAKMTDVDGNVYIDYVGSWGPMILGHSHPAVTDAVRDTLKRGASFGAPTPLEVEMAELVVEMVPSVEMVRMVNSGTEATMSAIRVARGHTGRDLILKFDGCYHGHGDSLLVKAGSGVETLGLPDSPGVPAALAALTLTLPYNDLDAVKDLFESRGEEIACVIIEPVIGNMGCIPPRPGYLAGIRELCNRFGVVLIFDEVMTGFRLAPGGAQERFDVTPDLTTLGKVIGGGLPVGAYGGKREIMEKVAPAGPIYQAGTLSGNPLAMAAGIAMLTELKKPGVYDALEAKTNTLTHGLRGIVERLGVPTAFAQVGSMFCMYFTDKVERVMNGDDARTADAEKFGKYHAGMLSHGVYLAPSQFEAGFMSLAHTDDDIWKTLEAAEASLKSL